MFIFSLTPWHGNNYGDADKCVCFIIVRAPLHDHDLQVCRNIVHGIMEENCHNWKLFKRQCLLPLLFYSTQTWANPAID